MSIIWFQLYKAFTMQTPLYAETHIYLAEFLNGIFGVLKTSVKRAM